MTPLNHDIVSVPAGILEAAGKGWKPQKEQFCEDKSPWVPGFGDCISVRYKRGPWGDEVGS